MQLQLYCHEDIIYSAFAVCIYKTLPNLKKTPPPHTHTWLPYKYGGQCGQDLSLQNI